MPTDNDPYWKLRPPPPTPDDETCACTSVTPVVLQPHLSPNPLSCARCNLEVPPDRIRFDEHVADSLASWRDFHDCFYFLWLDSGEFEEWAKGHLRDPMSAVNTRGLELVAQINVFRRCYLWWFQDEEMRIGNLRKSVRDAPGFFRSCSKGSARRAAHWPSAGTAPSRLPPNTWLHLTAATRFS